METDLPQLEHNALWRFSASPEPFPLVPTARFPALVLALAASLLALAAVLALVLALALALAALVLAPALVLGPPPSALPLLTPPPFARRSAASAAA